LLYHCRRFKAADADQADVVSLLITFTTRREGGQNIFAELDEFERTSSFKKGGSAARGGGGGGGINE
jgi:hypothetical protein